MHDPHAISDGERLFLVVSDEERGDPDLELHPTDLVAQSRPHLGIERRKRLIEQQHHGLDGERAGQGYALLLAPRQLVGEAVGKSG